MERELVNLTQYGHVEIDIRSRMEKKNISRNALARALNTRFEVVDKWYNGQLERIDADVLARICYVLGCKPGDIIRYHAPE